MGKRTVLDIPAKPQLVIELPCPVCGYPPDMDAWSCDGCGVELHAECFWGRVATLEEWRTFQQSSRDAAGQMIGDEPPPPVRCPSCRGKGGA